MELDEDTINDAIDQNIQAAIGHARGRTLQGLVPQLHDEKAEPGEPDDDLDEMLAQEEKNDGGGGAGILGSLGGILGG